MQQVQLVGLTPQENNKPIFEYIDKKFDELKNFYQPKEPKKYLTRIEVSKMLSVDISTVHNLTKRNVLEKYQIGGRCLYLRSQVEESIVKINN
jgi:hypothetical protein